MMFEIPLGATSLTDEDMAGLLPNYLSTRADLNLVEAENISKAKRAFRRSVKKYSDIEFLLSEPSVREVHKMMYGDVWKWAGVYRSHTTNIGVPPEQIREQLINLLLNTEERVKYCPKDQVSRDELAIRFHWELVSIHPFPNGNGRHSRQMADLLIEAMGYPAFSWGRLDLVDANTMRNRYIEALRKADATADVIDLLEFART